MTFYEFIQWCFKDDTSGFVTLIVLGGIGNFLVSFARAIRGNDYNTPDEDEYDD